MSYWTKENVTYVIEHGMLFAPAKTEAKVGKPEDISYTEEEIYNIYVLKKNSLTLLFDTTRK